MTDRSGRKRKRSSFVFLVMSQVVPRLTGRSRTRERRGGRASVRLRLDAGRRLLFGGFDPVRDEESGSAREPGLERRPDFADRPVEEEDTRRRARSVDGIRKTVSESGTARQREEYPGGSAATQPGRGPSPPELRKALHCQTFWSPCDRFTSKRVWSPW